MITYIFIYISILTLRFVFQKKHFTFNGLSTSNKIGVNHYKSVDAFFLSSFLLLLFFTGFRGETVGIDVSEYIEWFREFNDLGWKNTFVIKKDVELGYLLLNYSVSFFSQNPHYLILSVSFVILVLHLFFLKKTSKNFFLSLMLYLSFNHFFTSMSSWRQFIAMGIVFFVYPLLLNKRFFLAILVMMIASFFHFSTILFDVAILMGYFFSKKKKWLLFFLIFCILSPPFFERVFFTLIEMIPKYSFYATSQPFGEVGKLRYVYIIIEVLLILYVVKTKSLKKRNINLMCIMLCFSILVGLLGKNIPLMFRFGYYFEYFLLLIIPEIIYYECKKKSIYIETFVIVFGFVFYFYYMLTNSAGMIPWYMYY